MHLNLALPLVRFVVITPAEGLRLIKKSPWLSPLGKGANTDRGNMSLVELGIAVFGTLVTLRCPFVIREDIQLWQTKGLPPRKFPYIHVGLFLFGPLPMFFGLPFLPLLVHVIAFYGWMISLFGYENFEDRVTYERNRKRKEESTQIRGQRVKKPLPEQEDSLESEVSRTYPFKALAEEGEEEAPVEKEEEIVRSEDYYFQTWAKAQTTAVEEEEDEVVYIENYAQSWANETSGRKWDGG